MDATANDAVDAVSALSGPRASAAIGQIAQRYGRVLGLSARDIAEALQAAREVMRKGTALPPARRGDDVPDQAAIVEPTQAAE